MIKVIVGSTNPVKIQCVKEGFEQMLKEETTVITGQSCPSGVSDQPVTNAETYQGAYNRALFARDHFNDADYWVGVEGGIGYHEYDMEAFAWIVILSREKLGKARTSSFVLPKAIRELVESGIELGQADDIVFKKTNSKHNNGAVGILTNDEIDRKSYYQQAVVLALIPFIQTELY